MKQLLKQCAEWLSEHSEGKEAQELLQEIRSKLRMEEGIFTVSVVSRDDLISQGYDANAVDDRTMERIALSMNKAHKEYGEYWFTLTNACSNEDVPLLDEA